MDGNDEVTKTIPQNIKTGAPAGIKYYIVHLSELQEKVKG